MKRIPAKYTFLVWLWSMMLSPLIAAVLQFYYYDGQIDKLDWLKMYPLIFIIEILITGLIWVLFWAITAIFANSIRSDTAFRLVTSLIGFAITVSITWVFSSASFSLTDLPASIALANCLCIFAGCWYFDIEAPIAKTFPPPVNTESYEQTTE